MFVVQLPPRRDPLQHQHQLLLLLLLLLLLQLRQPRQLLLPYTMTELLSSSSDLLLRQLPLLV